MRARPRFRRCLLALALLVASVSSASTVAQDYIDGPVVDEDPLLTDARMYAHDVGVSLEEAVRRLELQQPAGDLQAALMEDAADVFGGAWIQHQPDWRVVVQLTSGDAEVVHPYIIGTALDGLVETRQVESTLEELMATQRSVIADVQSLDIQFESNLNIMKGEIELYVEDRTPVDDALHEGRLNFPEFVEVIEDELSSDALDIYAGLGLSSCTSGYTVKQVSGTLTGVTTAGHCAEPSEVISYQGVNLPFKYEAWGGSFDVQWHVTPGILDRPWAKTTSGYRVITGKKSWSQQMIGEYVCKYGKVSLYTCGWIMSTNWQPTCCTKVFNPTFILVYNQAVPIQSSSGDSGGPWYSGYVAYGIVKGHKGGNDNHGPYGIYMPINFAETGLGVVLLLN